MENSAERQDARWSGKMSGWSEPVSARSRVVRSCVFDPRNQELQQLLINEKRNCSNFLFKGISEGILGCFKLSVYYTSKDT